MNMLLISSLFSYKRTFNSKIPPKLLPGSILFLLPVFVNPVDNRISEEFFLRLLSASFFTDSISSNLAELLFLYCFWLFLSL